MEQTKFFQKINRKKVDLSIVVLCAATILLCLYTLAHTHSENEVVRDCNQHWRQQFASMCGVSLGWETEEALDVSFENFTLGVT